MQKNINFNRQESILLCKKGIEEKRLGNYDEALIFYEKAKVTDPTNQDVYYNFAKINLGLGKNDKAIRYFLIYLHLSIYNDISYDPASGDRLFNNLLDVEYHDPVRQKLFIYNLQHFNYDYKNGPGFITNFLTISGDLIKLLCIHKPPLQLCILDHNLTFYAGFCYILDNDKIRFLNKITDEDVIDTKNGLLARSSNKIIRNTFKENLCLLVGFMYLAINLKWLKDILEVPIFYLDRNLIIKRDLHNYEKYIDSQDYF